MPPPDLTSILLAPNKVPLERFIAIATKLEKAFLTLDYELYQNGGKYVPKINELPSRLLCGRLALRCLSLHFPYFRDREEKLTRKLKMSPCVLGKLLQENPQMWHCAMEACTEMLLSTDRDVFAWHLQEDLGNGGSPEVSQIAWGLAIVEYISGPSMELPSKERLAKVLTIDNGVWLESSQTLHDAFRSLI
jgi:hypothetical protein